MRKSILSMLAFGLLGCASNPQGARTPANAFRDPAGVDVLDVFDMQNLHIYTSQGFMNNHVLRELIPLPYLRTFIDKKVARTCEGLFEANVPYLNRVFVTPSAKLPAKDAKLYILVSEALQRLPVYPGTYYHGSNICSIARDESNRLRPEFIERAFMGVSEKKSSAEYFTRKRDEVDDGVPSGCMMTVESSTSRRVYDLTGNFNDAREILFPMNTGFRLLGSTEAGLRTDVIYRELDPVMERDVIERLKIESYIKTLKLYYPWLTGQRGSRKPRRHEEFGPEQEKRRLSEIAEAACEDAEKFFSTDPAFRSKIDKEFPVYDLKNKKLNPDDYPAVE